MACRGVFIIKSSFCQTVLTPVSTSNPIITPNLSLTPNTRVGVYEIIAPVGAGGMGEVYRARDTRLHRDVALKVLPDAFASDPERLARFEREAQTLAGLNHPHIAQIYGVEDSQGTRALVMEFVDGEDLRQRLERGALPLDDALAIARQMTDALAAAHESGIIHRDLKPANVKLGSDGRVKLLDFGLAKAFEGPGQSAVNAMNSPTLTARATAVGVILGTAAYMAPEQAKGKSVDRRADVWAFGVVLYEMLTGRRAFDGADTSELIASVLRDSPELDRLPPGTPPSIHRLLRRCLEKDPSRRLDSMAAARLEIEDASRGEPSPQTPPPPSAQPSKVLWPVAVAILLAAIPALAWLATQRSPVSLPSLRVSAAFGGDAFFADQRTFNRSIAISRDGKAVAYIAQPGEGGRPQLFYRRLDSLVATPIEGTDEAVEPFFSPKGDWIGFFSGGKLRKVAVAGGGALPLADFITSRGAFWGEDDVITFAPHATLGGKLMRIPAAGGTPVELGPFVEGHVTQRWPQVLPGNRVVLYTGLTHVDHFDDACLVVQPLPSGSPRVVECGGSAWRYVPSGHVLYVHRGTLFAKRFDLASLTTQGSATALVEEVSSNVASGSADFSIADDGTLVYLSARAAEPSLPIEIIDSAGGITTLPIDPQHWQTMSFSPDGRQLAIEVAAAGQSDLWLYDQARDALSRLTFTAVTDGLPVWTPDGQIIFSSALGGPPGLFSKAADGSGDDHRLLPSNFVRLPSSLDASGRQLVFMEQNAQGDWDVVVVTRNPDGRSVDPASTRKLVATRANEGYGRISPDGKWLAYASDESGAHQVYVRSFSGEGGRVQVSTGGGLWPTWTKDRQLLYCTQLGEMMSVRYDVVGTTFRPQKPTRWVEPRIRVRALTAPYALHPDGTKIAATTVPPGGETRQRSFVLFTNFFEKLPRHD